MLVMAKDDELPGQNRVARAILSLIVVQLLDVSDDATQFPAFTVLPVTSRRCTINRDCHAMEAVLDQGLESIFADLVEIDSVRRSQFDFCLLRVTDYPLQVGVEKDLSPV
jgi:hypothetical protein